MQLGVDARHAFRAVGMAVQLVGDVVVIQGFLQHIGCRLFQDLRGRFRRCDQQVVYFLPGDIVTDRHRRIQHQPAVLCQGRVVDHIALQQFVVGDGYLFVLEGQHPGADQAFLQHHAGYIFNPYHIADMKCPGIGLDHPSHDIGDRRGGGQREQRSQENRDPPEYRRVRARYIRKADHKRRRNDQEGHDPAGEIRPVRVKPRDRDAAPPYLAKNKFIDPVQEVKDHRDDPQADEIIHVLNQPGPRHPQRGCQDRDHTFRQVSRCRE